MPRRRDPIKSPELSVLLRDARPTWHVIEGEPNPRKRRERIARAKSASDALIKICRAAQKRGSLARLDIRVRNFCEDLKAGSSGHLPKPKGGAPIGKRHQRLLLAVKVHEEIEARKALGEKSVTDQVLRDLAEQMAERRTGVGYDYLKRIHYDRDPEWEQAVRVELDRRKKDVPFSPALWLWEEDLFLQFLIAPR
jgi:hypothetical protein